MLPEPPVVVPEVRKQVLEGILRSSRQEPEWPAAAERVLERLEGTEECGAISGDEVLVILWPDELDTGSATE